MGWEIKVDKIENGKVQTTVVGHVTSSSDKDDTIDVAILLSPKDKEATIFQFKMSTGRAIVSKDWKLNIKEVNLLNDPKKWEKPKKEAKSKSKEKNIEE